MANETLSNPTQGSVFANHIEFLDGIPAPICSKHGSDTTVNSAHDRCLTCPQCDSANQVFRLKRDLEYIQDSLKKLDQITQQLSERLTSARPALEETSRSVVGPEINEIVSAVTHLKFQLPVSYYEFSVNDVETPTTQPQEQQMDPTDPAAEAYTNLGDNYKKCLWCFLVFPEKAKIKKRVLINWWAAGRWLENSTAGGGRMSAEQAGEDLLELLEQKQLIKRVEREGRPSDVWWMEPAVRSYVKSIDGSSSSVDGTTLLDPNPSQIGVSPSEIRTIFNVNGSRVDLEAEHLAAVRSLQVLHLGRSQTPACKPSIQVKGFEFMKGLKKMKRLRLLSLQGILSLRNLPSSVCELTELTVLDLRACQALESLPSKIGKLKNLTHLDLSSACFDLLQMPSGIASLTNLEVLKGFVVNQPKPRSKSKTCSLRDLRKLKNLHALSIFVSKENLLQPSDLEDLFHIDELFKLKIVWKPAAEVEQVADGFANQEKGKIVLKVAAKLKKLDLWCIPENAAKVLVDPGRFPKLEKLYVRGATLKSLKGDLAGKKWSAQTLRLLYLPRFEMESEDLKNLFPNLSYLEYKGCPEFTFPGSDGGVWRNGG